jgi:hypothetical protein
MVARLCRGPVVEIHVREVFSGSEPAELVAGAAEPPKGDVEPRGELRDTGVPGAAEEAVATV